MHARPPPATSRQPCRMNTDRPHGRSPILCRDAQARGRRRAARWLVLLGVELLGLIASAVMAGTPAVAAIGSNRWVWPLVPAPDVVGAYNPPDAPWLPGHRGVDLAGHPRQPVHAAGAGQVSFAGQIAGVPVVVVDHGTLRTTYEPVHPTVDVGEIVTAGDVIGRLATAGGHCLPETCLHWGLLRGDSYLDPLLLLGGGPVRLLPLSGSGLPPGTTLARSKLTRPATLAQSDAASAGWSADLAETSAGGWNGRARPPKPDAKQDPRAAMRSPSTADSWLWTAGWVAVSAVGAGSSLRFSARWARRGSWT
jgi:murein DD-endopeptidase MepM/ murein hydrolase activator NlpD